MNQSDSDLTRSARLHARVRAFAYSALSASGGTQDTFASLLEDITAFQMRACEGQRRLAAGTGAGFLAPGLATEVFPVTADCFRFSDVFAFPKSFATHRFLTSGTTSGARGVHHMRELRTYSELSVLLARRYLLRPGTDRMMCLALMQEGGAHTSSSLGFMCQRFMDAIDARELFGRRPAASVWQEPERWLLTAEGVRLDALSRAVEQAHSDNEPILLLTTAFALVMLLDALGSRRLSLPPGSVVMPTGGFKGRTREVAPDELWDWVERQLSPEFVVGEYGMTELSSQLYEYTAGERGMSRDPSLYVEPPWLRVVPLAPDTLQPVALGCPGLACFIDLANIDSAIAVVTQDMVQRQAHGVRLLGRRRAAPLRGCSLSAEELLESLK